MKLTFLLLACIASLVVHAEDSPVVVTIQCDKTIYNQEDDIVINVSVSNRTDQAVKIGSTTPQQLAVESDYLFIVKSGEKVKQVVIFEPIWPRSLNIQENILVPPNGVREFKNVIIKNEKWNRDRIRGIPGRYDVFWVLREFKESGTRPRSNTITIEIKGAQPSSGASSPSRQQLALGMSMQDVISLHGLHFKKFIGMRAGTLDMVYDDVTVSIRDSRDAENRSGVVYRIEGPTNDTCKELVKNIPYEDEKKVNPNKASETIGAVEQQKQIQNIIEGIIPKGWSIKTIVDVKNPYGWTEIKDLRGITFEISFDANLLKEWAKKQNKHIKLFIPYVRLTFMPSAYNGTQAPESLDRTLQVTGFPTERWGKWNNFIIFADRGFGYPIDNSCYDSFWPFTRNEIRKAFNLEATEIKLKKETPIVREDLARLSVTNISAFWQGLLPTIHTNDPSGCILSGRDGYICAKCWEWIKPYEEKSRIIGITVFTSQSAAIAAMEFRLRNIAPATVAGANDGTFPGPWHHGHSGGGLSAFICVNYRNCIIEVSILNAGYDENATLLKETATAVISQISVIAQTNVPNTNSVTDFLQFLNKPENEIPAEARTVLDELKKSNVPNPKTACDLVVGILSEPEKNFIRMDARSFLPHVIRLHRLEKDMTDEVKAGELVWTVQWSYMDPEKKQEYLVVARTGKTIALNKASEAGNLVVSVYLTNGIFRAGERIEIHATYSNRSEIAVDVDEGSLRAQFPDTEQERMFRQSIRASYCHGIKTVTLKPGEEYKDTLTLEPTTNVTAGMFKVKIVSRIRRGSTQTVDMGVVVFEIR